MKKVHTPDMVIHLWANASQPEARTQTGHCFYNTTEGKGEFAKRSVLYSYGYHYVIGTRLERDDGSVVFVMNTTPSSMTTNGQCRDAQAAVPECHRVNVLYLEGNYSQHFHFEEHKELVMSHVADKLSEAAKGTAKLRPQRMADTLAYINQFNKVLRILAREVKPIDAEAALGVDLDALNKTLCDAEAAARKERAQNAEKRLGFAKAEAKLWQEDKTSEAMARYNTTGILRDAGLGVPIRLSQDKSEVQTMQGATVSAKAALRLWATLQDKTAKQNDAVGPFRVDNIADEFITIGCHKIATADMAAIAAQLGAYT